MDVATAWLGWRSTFGYAWITASFFGVGASRWVKSREVITPRLLLVGKYKCRAWGPNPWVQRGRALGSVCLVRLCDMLSDSSESKLVWHGSISYPSQSTDKYSWPALLIMLLQTIDSTKRFPHLPIHYVNSTLYTLLLLVIFNNSWEYE
jgi:hypothetical protein